MKILYENKHLAVVVKPVGVLSEESGNKQSVPLLLKEQWLRAGAKNPAVYTVHRLDRDVGGLMVVAKDSATAAALSRSIAERTMTKEYLAVIKGCPEEPEGIMEDLLFRDASKGKTYVTDRMRAGVRDARLCYQVLESVSEQGELLTLVKVRLITGRTHQIRVQFASRKMPLLGDGRYGSRDGGDKPALFSCHLCCKGMFDLSAIPTEYPFSLFSTLLEG